MEQPNTLTAIIRRCVIRWPDRGPKHSCRMGTCFASLEQFEKVFGEPDEQGSADDKVTKSWHFDTVRGRVTVRDYWWNGLNELSIAAAEWKAALWMAACLRRIGLKAKSTSRRDLPGLKAALSRPAEVAR